MAETMAALQPLTGNMSSSWKTPPLADELAALIHAARTGDDSAFGMLVSFYQSTAQRVARRIMRTEEAAADAVQDALIKAHRAMPRFQDGNFSAWLMRIVTNTCYDHLRRQKRRPTVSLDELMEPGYALHIADSTLSPTPQQNPEQVAVQREEMRALLSAIGRLPAYHRQVVVLVDVQGYNYQEAAELLDLPLGTVKSRLSRARSSLRDDLVACGLV